MLVGETEIEAAPSAEDEIDRWLATERSRLARPAPEPPRSDIDAEIIANFQDLFRLQQAAVDAFTLFSARSGLIEAEDQRTEEEFDSDLEGYLAHCRDVLQQQTAYLLCRHPANTVNLSLVNNTETVFRDVKVVATICAAEVLEHVEQWPKIPSEPRPWRSRRAIDWQANLTAGSMYHGFGLGTLGLVRRARPLAEVEIEAIGDNVEAVFDPVDLRPGDQLPLPDLRVLPRGADGHALRITWKATALNADGRNQGTLSVMTTASKLSLAALGESDPGVIDPLDGAQTAVQSELADTRTAAERERDALRADLAAAKHVPTERDIRLFKQFESDFPAAGDGVVRYLRNNFFGKQWTVKSLETLDDLQETWSYGRTFDDPAVEAARVLFWTRLDEFTTLLGNEGEVTDANPNVVRLIESRNRPGGQEEWEAARTRMRAGAAALVTAHEELVRVARKRHL